MLKDITINAIVEYIENNLELMQINTESLVNYSGYSRRYLQLLFAKAIGIPVGKYIQMRRISRAASLLRFTQLSISDISERLFYDSQQTFTREFKKNSGYTPLQYRKSKIWSFKNMLGRRKANYNYPVPTMRLLKHKKFHGTEVFYKNIVPSATPLPALKWRMVDLFLPKENKSIYISHKLESNKKTLYFNAIFWSEENTDVSGELDEGLYAYFSLKGNKNDYQTLIYNIYMNTLPFYGLQIKNSYDLEIIKKLGTDMYHFEYFLPVDCDNNMHNVYEHRHRETPSDTHNDGNKRDHT